MKKYLIAFLVALALVLVPVSTVFASDPWGNFEITNVTADAPWVSFNPESTAPGNVQVTVTVENDHEGFLAPGKGKADADISVPTMTVTEQNPGWQTINAGNSKNFGFDVTGSLVTTPDGMKDAHVDVDGKYSWFGFFWIPANGDCETAASLFGVDSTAPTISHNLQNGNVNVNVVDNLSGVGDVQYQIGNGSWQPYTGAIPYNYQNFPAGQNTIVRVTAFDNAENPAGYQFSYHNVATGGGEHPLMCMKCWTPMYHVANYAWEKGEFWYKCPKCGEGNRVKLVNWILP